MKKDTLSVIKEKEKEEVELKMRVYLDVAIWMRNRGFNEHDTVNMEELQECLGDFWNDKFNENSSRSTIISILESLREEIGEDIDLKHEECVMEMKEMCDICIGRTITNDERQRMRNHLTTLITDLKK